MTRKTLIFCFVLVTLAFSLHAGGNKELRDNITIGNFWGDWDIRNFRPQNDTERLMLEWRRTIRDTHGLSIREKAVADFWGMLPAITTSIMAGKPAAQAIIVTPDWAMSLYRQRLLAALSDSNAVDLSTREDIVGRQAAYNHNTEELFTFDGKQYALTFGYGGSRHSMGVYFNKRLFLEAGVDPNLPFDMQKNGTWTWDAFFELCKRLSRDVNNDGIIDVYAMAQDNRLCVVESFIFSNGGEYVGKNNSGFYFAADRPEAIEAMNFVRRMNGDGIMMEEPPNNENYDWHMNAFMTGQVAMIFESEWRVDSLSRMRDDWGYVLPPKGPRMDTYRFSTDENVIVIPVTYSGEDLDMILQAVNLWFMPVTLDWKPFLANNYRDSRSVDETMEMIRSPRYGVFKNHALIPNMRLDEMVWHIYWWDGDPGSLVETVSQNWRALIEDANRIR